MDIRDTLSIYFELCGGSNAMESISIAEATGVKERVDKMVEAGLTKDEILGAVKATQKEETRGRKLREIKNPHYEHFLSFAMDELSARQASEVDDCVVGVSRSFDYNEDQKRAGLSPKKLAKVMTLSVLSSKSVASILSVGDRHARRYLKAAEMLIDIFDRKLK